MKEHKEIRVGEEVGGRFNVVKTKMLLVCDKKQFDGIRTKSFSLLWCTLGSRWLVIYYIIVILDHIYL